VKVAALKQRAFENDAAIASFKMQGEWKWRVEEQKLLWIQLQDLRLKMLPNATLIQETATQQLKAGELNYLSWMLMVEPALQSKLNYLEKVLVYRQATTQLLFLAETNN
jgi:cobalt-zinc-cadmium resistance protein CzcA